MRGVFFRFLMGSVTLAYPAAKHTAVLRYLLENGIGAMECRLLGEEGCLVLRRRDAARLPSGLACREIGEWGLLVLCKRLLHRPGLIFGAALGVCLLVLSSLTVWRVEVTGNQHIGALEIEEAVREAGLSVGAFTPTVDVATVRTRLLSAHPEISWVGIYIRGTTAAIEVRESVLHESTDAVSGYCNVVSSADAVVESIHVAEGRAAVSVGTSVRKGDLLISGIYRTAAGLRAVCAAGEVRGRTVRTLSVTVPCEVVQREYGTAKTVGLSLTFFGKDIKLFQKDLKSVEKYDIINRKEQLVLFGIVPLPVYFTREECLPYREVTATMSAEETEAAARARLHGEMAVALSDAEVLTEETRGEWTDNGYTLSCRVECVVDIVMPLDYEVLKDGG